MEHDIFFSISQTPDHEGHIPSEETMLKNYFQQLNLADELGFGVGWIAQSHLSTETQKSNSKPVVPHWKGEVGLCTDFPQLALESFSQTNSIEIGSAVVSILASGGPIAQAERIANTLQLLAVKGDTRKLHVGFSAGRFEFMARPYGIIPRDIVEEAAWPALRGQIFAEASEIFLKLLNGEVVNSKNIRQTVLTRSNFRSDEDWLRVQEAVMKRDSISKLPNKIHIPNRYVFEDVKNIPQSWNRELLDLILGSHDGNLQKEVNKIRPVKVFNLSITPPEVIEATHDRMTKHYNSNGGNWKRNYMPRTLMIFVNDEPNLSEAEKTEAAKQEAKNSLSSYWGALEGTIDPNKVSRAADNSVIGNVEEVAQQIAERFHPDDCIMTWFDFFNHDSPRVIRNMEAFMKKVVPRVEELTK